MVGHQHKAAPFHPKAARKLPGLSQKVLVNRDSRERSLVVDDFD